MSIRAMIWAFDQDCPGPTAKLVLIKLADCANEDTGECWPSQGRVAADTGLARETVCRQIKHLANAGLIRVEHRSSGSGRLSSRYFLLCDGGSLSSPKVTDDHNLSDRRSQTKVTDDHRHYVEPKLEPKKKLPPLKSPTGDDGFEVFWQVYPKKVAKPAALKAWAKARKGADPPTIIDGARRYVAAHPCGYEFWKNPSGWLNDGRWTDELAATNGTQNGHNKPLQPLTDAECEEVLRRAYGR